MKQEKQNRNLVSILDDMSKVINYCSDSNSPELMQRLNELNEEAQNEFNRSYRKCDACGEWVDEDLLENRYDEYICEQCRENGYGE